MCVKYNCILQRFNNERFSRTLKSKAAPLCNTVDLQMSRSKCIIFKFARIYLLIIALCCLYWNKSFTKESKHLLRSITHFIQVYHCLLTCMLLCLQLFHTYIFNLSILFLSYTNLVYFISFNFRTK